MAARLKDKVCITIGAGTEENVDEDVAAHLGRSILMTSAPRSAKFLGPTQRRSRVCARPSATASQFGWVSRIPRSPDQTPS